MFPIDTAEALQHDAPARHPFRIRILSLRTEIVDCNLYSPSCRSLKGPSMIESHPGHVVIVELDNSDSSL